MTAPVHLDGTSIEAIARRVAELLVGEHGSGIWIDATEVARRFGFSRDYVYRHADELGAVRIGDGPNARLRFDVSVLTEKLRGFSSRGAELPKRATQRSVRSLSAADLLPIRGRLP